MSAHVGEGGAVVPRLCKRLSRQRQPVTMRTRMFMPRNWLRMLFPKETLSRLTLLADGDRLVFVWQPAVAACWRDLWSN